MLEESVATTHSLETFFRASLRLDRTKTIQQAERTYRNVVEIDQRKKSGYKSKMHVWTYWENAPGSRRPEYLDLCEESIVKNLGDNELHKVTPENLGDYLPNIHPRLFRIDDIPSKADYIRAALVFEHGGVWIDSDTIVTRPLFDFLSLLTPGTDFLVCHKTSHGDNYMMNLFASKKKGVIIERFLEKLHKIMDSTQNITFGSLGAHALTPVVRASVDVRVELVPESKCKPIPWQEASRYMSPSEPLDELLRGNPYLIMLYNQLFPPWFKSMDAQEALHSKTLIGKLLRKSIGNKHERH